MNTTIKTHKSFQYFKTSKGWFVDMRDTFSQSCFACESEADCVACIDFLLKGL